MVTKFEPIFVVSKTSNKIKVLICKTYAACCILGHMDYITRVVQRIKVFNNV